MSCNTKCICLKCGYTKLDDCCLRHNKDCDENMIGACFDYKPMSSSQGDVSTHEEQNKWLYDEKHDDYICLKCHKVSFSRTQYCPHCGQKMIL